MVITKQQLTKRTFSVLFIATILSIIAYCWIDAPLVYWLNGHNTQEWPIIIILRPIAAFITFIPHWLFTPMFVILGLRAAFSKITIFEKNILLLLIILLIGYDGIVSAHLRSIIGRPWPSLWGHAQHSLLTSGSSRFHFGFHNQAKGSFPSGHALMVTMIATFAWYVWPKIRYYVAAFAFFTCIMMVIQYYQYLSDVIAGAGLGYLITLFSYYICSHKKLQLNNE